MVCYFHPWARAHSCYLNMLEKLQKRVFRAVSPTLTSSLELLGRCWNVATMSFSYRHYFDRCPSSLVEEAIKSRFYDERDNESFETFRKTKGLY